MHIRFVLFGVIKFKNLKNKFINSGFKINKSKITKKKKYK